MTIERVAVERMPDGHTWAIIERDGWVRVLAIDGVAERVALLQLEKLAHAV